MLLVLLALSLSSAQSSTANRAISRYNPDVETLLLDHGYEQNIITLRGLRGLRASQRSYATSVWTRDLDYAIRGYGFALRDMSVFRESIELFLARVDGDGVVPETIHSTWPEDNDHENRQSWDSMPNLIHAVYRYVAKTGDTTFYRRHRRTIQRVGQWIARLDRDGDGLPDHDTYPYGYYDSVANGVMHTYALAMFYAAFNELAELESHIGEDGSVWEQRAASLRKGFHQPLDEGGYWPDNRDWPIAWRTPDGTVYPMLETFGIFEALRSGLIAPSDGQRYHNLIAALDTHFDELTAGPVPVKLALGGYPAEVRREVDPPVPMWMLDASAPWIVGLAAPAYAAAGHPDHAHALVESYTAMVQTTTPPVIEFAAEPGARYGAGRTEDRGRTWDSAAWFMAVYGGHYGLTMTPATLIVQPNPYQEQAGDGIENFSYQGAHVHLDLAADRKTYRIQADSRVPVVLRPMGDSKWMRVNGSARRTEETITLQPGQTYVVVSESAPGPPPTPTLNDAPPPFDGFFATPEMYDVWARTDFPTQNPPPGMQARSWIWGPQPLSAGFYEPYREGEGGERLVQYFDKSRMEINQPDAPRNEWYVTNGLLVVEMIEGKMQVGNNTFQQHTPAEQAVAGDPAQDNPDAPTYRSLQAVTRPASAHRAPDRRGDVVTTVLNRSGTTRETPSMARYNVAISAYEQATGHNIADVFTTFFAQEGMVLEQGNYVYEPVLDWLFVVGLPISEPYWARVKINGVEKDVLMQAFERRVLTYTPANKPQWRVEMGNVGQHYLRWRYGE
jgi:hypothetical protein